MTPPETPSPGSSEAPSASSSTAADLLDWDRALSLARGAVPAGPRVPEAARRTVVDLLREGARSGPVQVAAVTGLRAAAASASRSTQVLVVDRPGVMALTAQSLREVMHEVPAPPAGALAKALASGEVTTALAALSTRLLGQVLPAPAAGPPPGPQPLGGSDEASCPDEASARLLVVAPNVLALQRRQDLDLFDLTRWVTLHESVHAVQLAAAPWLAPLLGEFLGTVVRGVVLRGPALAQAREALTALSAVLSVLEGHAEVVLDEVTPAELASVHRLRSVVGPVPSRQGGLVSLLERLTGARGKARQHADGAAFVRTVVQRCGHEGLNRLWLAPENLPSAQEVGQPGAWTERVGG